MNKIDYLVASAVLKKESARLLIQADKFRECLPDIAEQLEQEAIEHSHMGMAAVRVSKLLDKE